MDKTGVSKNLKPFDLICLEFYGNPNELAQTTENFTKVYVPAIFIAAYQNEMDWKTLMSGLNQAAVITGTGAIINGAGRIAILGGVDVLLGGSALVINDYQTEILKLKNGKELLSAYDVLNKAFLLYFASKTIVSLSSAIATFRNAKKIIENSDDFVKLKATNPSLAKSIQEETEAILTKADEIVWRVQGAGNVAEALKARQLLAQLKTIEPQVTDDLLSLANKNGGKMEGLDFRLKSEESLIRKLVAEGLNSPMNDVLRYTTTFDDVNFVKGIENTLNNLKTKGYEVVKLKNTFTDGSMYKGININMKTPSAQIFELQFHTPNSFNVKQNINHVLYEEYRLLNENSARALELKNLMINNSNSVINPPNIQSIK